MPEPKLCQSLIFAFKANSRRCGRGRLRTERKSGSATAGVTSRAHVSTCWRHLTPSCTLRIGEEHHAERTIAQTGDRRTHRARRVGGPYRLAPRPFALVTSDVAYDSGADARFARGGDRRPGVVGTAGCKTRHRAGACFQNRAIMGRNGRWHDAQDRFQPRTGTVSIIH